MKHKTTVLGVCIKGIFLFSILFSVGGTIASAQATFDWSCGANTGTAGPYSDPDSSGAPVATQEAAAAELCRDDETMYYDANYTINAYCPGTFGPLVSSGCTYPPTPALPKEYCFTSDKTSGFFFDTEECFYTQNACNFFEVHRTMPEGGGYSITAASKGCVPVGPCVGHNYSAWSPSTCPASGTQTRTVITGIPVDCVGGTVPVTTQTCTPPNAAPTVNAGANQTVTENDAVTLSGSASDSDGTIVSYSWTQSGGPTASFTSSASNPSTSFTAPSVTATQALTFVLTVTDNEGAVSTDSVTITVNDTAAPTPTPTPTPSGPPTCTGFTYGGWLPSTCPSSGVQTRTILSKTPSGCVGGSPSISQTCTYTPAASPTLGNYIGTPTFAGFMQAILGVFIQIGVMVLTIFAIYTGYLFVTAQGNEERLAKAKTAFKWLLVGGAIIIGSQAIAVVITNTVGAL